MDANQTKPENGKPSKFKIESLPRETRKKIFVFIVIILMLIVVITWLVNLQNINFENAPPIENQKIEDIKNDLDQLYQFTAETLEQLKTQVAATPEESTSPPTSTVEIPAEDIEKLKEKVLENANQ